MTYTFGRIGSLLGAPAAINGVISEIEAAVNSLVSKTDNTGNQMSVSLDLNSNRILNLPPPLYDHEPARFSDLLSVQTGALTLLGPQASIRGGIFLSSPIATKFVSGVNSNGDLIYTRPTMTDISGLLPYATGAAGTGLNALATDFSHSYQALWLAGTYSGTGVGPYAEIRVIDTANSGGSSFPNAALRIDHNINSGASAGNRNSLLPILTKNVALAGTSPDLKFYTPFFSQFYVKSGDGGTLGTPYGAHYGFSSLIQAESGATYLDAVQGGEIDVAVQTGASTALKCILLLASVNNDAVKGSSYDGMLAFGTDSTTTAKWTYGITFGWPRGPWAFDTTSTLIGSVAPASGSRVANHGIDFSAITFSTAAFKSTGFTVDPAGAITGSTLISSGSNAGLVVNPRSGSGNLFMWYHTDGTSFKLYNGTADVFTVATDGSTNAPMFRTNAPVTKTGNYTVDSGAAKDNFIICNGTATITLTLPAASSNTGRIIKVKTIAAFTVVSASSNVIPITGGAAGTAILAATSGKWAHLVSDGTNWIIMANN